MVLDYLRDSLFPRVCVWCGHHGSYLCPTCKKSLRPHPESCPLTHRDSPWYAVRQDFLAQSSPLDGCIVLFRFEPLIKKLIRQLKYHHRADISGFLGERLALALQTHSLLHNAQWILHNENTWWMLFSQLIITYVPSHRYRRYVTKGYNQSQLLANALCRSLELPPAQALCRKINNTHSQVGLSRAERKKNLSGAFVCTATIAVGSTIIVVDDVLTSGATLLEMAQTIKSLQPQCQVWGLCVGRNG